MCIYKAFDVPRVKRVLKTQNSVNEDNNITINNDENEIYFPFRMCWKFGWKISENRSENGSMSPVPKDT